MGDYRRIRAGVSLLAEDSINRLRGIGHVDSEPSPADIRFVADMLAATAETLNTVVELLVEIHGGSISYVEGDDDGSNRSHSESPS